MRPLRVYADTSVFGGMFDVEFETETQVFFDQVAAGRFQVAISEMIEDELALAPQRVRNFFALKLPALEYLYASAEILRLSNLYVARGVLGKKSLADAAHIAYATVYHCDGVVSWNFKHIVHPDKARLFNMVNVTENYQPLFIASPKEILTYVQ